MRALVQRVSRASVDVDGTTVGEISQGLLILLSAMQSDTPLLADALAAKTAKLRIFRDDSGRVNRSLLDTGGGAMVVSQFTLAADTSRGNRPGFSTAASPELGAALYRHFTASLSALGIATQNGIFGADMAVSLINDGPVTIWLDTDN